MQAAKVREALEYNSAFHALMQVRVRVKCQDPLTLL